MHGKLLFIILFSFFSLLPHAAAAQTDIFDGPCRKYGIPKTLVLAIAKTESDLKPWVVNVAGKDFQARSKEEALRVVRAAKLRGLSHDIGIMQINNWWLKKLGISSETALEPHNNVLIGTWILAQEIRRHGYNWKAVGAYHSPNPSRGQRYAVAVSKRYNRVKQILTARNER